MVMLVGEEEKLVVRGLVVACSCVLRRVQGTHDPCCSCLQCTLCACSCDPCRSLRALLQSQHACSCSFHQKGLAVCIATLSGQVPLHLLFLGSHRWNRRLLVLSHIQASFRHLLTNRKKIQVTSLGNRPRQNQSLEVLLCPLPFAPLLNPLAGEQTLL